MHLRRFPFALLAAALLTACGARNALPGSAATPGNGGSGGSGGSGGVGGSAPMACAGPLVLGPTVIVDAATSSSEPEGGPSLVGDGERVFLAWPRWESSGYVYGLATAELSGGGLDLVSSVFVFPGVLSNPFNPQLAFAGDVLSLFWPLDDGTLSTLRLHADLNPIDPPHALPISVAAPPAITTAAIGVGDRTLLAWSDGGPSGPAARTFLGSFAPDGNLTGPVSLYEGSTYDHDTWLAYGQGRVFGAWSTHAVTAPDAPVTTFLAPIDPGTAKPTGLETVAVDTHRLASGLAVEADRVSVALFDAVARQAEVLSRPLAGGGFSPRATFPASAGVALAAGPCGLVALVPVGSMSPDNPLATGLSLRDVDTGAEVPLPVGGAYVESWRLVAVEGGVVAAWIEGGDVSPGRVLRMASLRAP